MSITENNLSAESYANATRSSETNASKRRTRPIPEPTGRFAHLLEDPTTIEERAPRTDETTVAIIGGGFAGLCTGRLKAAGINDITFIESGGDFGGVWYWNRYRAMCDTAAMVYLPLLEETNYFPSKYVQGYEIHEHAKQHRYYI